jgi:hypothetical protein
MHSLNPIKIRPETFCYLLRVIASACLRILALQVPAVESGVLRLPAHRNKHLDGGLPVLGVRFGGLKSVRFGLAAAARRSTRSSPGPGPILGFGLASGLRRRRQKAEQADRGLPPPSGGVGGVI